MKRVRIHADDHSQDVNFAETADFLAALAPGVENLTFLTFDDNKGRRDGSLTRVLHGTFKENAETLAGLNRRGAGVFVSVNETDQKGRRKENITRVRAVVLDLDGPPIEPVNECGLKPHIVVETSPDHYQVFWLVDGLPVDEFKGTVFSLAQHFDGDPGIGMNTLVVRLPGFFHSKGKRFRTRIVKLRKRRPYTAERIGEAFPHEDRPHKPPKSRALLFGNSPLKSAEEYVERECLPAGQEYAPPFGIAYFRDSYYEWTGPQYKQVKRGVIRKRLYGFADRALTQNKKGEYVPFDATSAKISQIEDALQSGVLLETEESPPFWIKRDKQEKATNLISCQNGLVDIHTRALLPHTPSFFNTVALPFEYDRDAPPPEKWFSFLEDIWPDDEQAERTLQEIIGLLLTSDTSHHKIFSIVGPPRSGKGTIARVLTALIGADNVATPTVASLSSNFGLAPLIDKSLAVITDARLGQSDTGALAERLLGISGEDGQQIDRKYQAHWSGRLSTRFLFLSNDLLRINDASGALAKRFVLLTLQKTFYGKEDLDLTGKLMTELPGILNWALDGLKRLNKRGHFIQPESSKGHLDLLEDLGSPTQAFLKDWCVVGSGKRINTKKAYAAYRAWCESHGNKPGNSSVFGKLLMSCIPKLTTKGSGSKRVYVGFELSEEGEQEFDSATRS